MQLDILLTLHVIEERKANANANMANVCFGWMYISPLQRAMFPLSMQWA